MTTERERVLNDATRRVLVRENYDAHYATIEERVLVEDRLFLARWDALIRYLNLDPATLLPSSLIELGRGRYLSDYPAFTGATLVMYRDNNGDTFVRQASDGTAVR